MRKTDLIVAIALIILVILAISLLAITTISCKNAGSLCENRSLGYCEEGK